MSSCSPRRSTDGSYPAPGAAGHPVASRKKASICDSWTPRTLHPQGFPALSTCQFLIGASPSEPWIEIDPSHHKYDSASRPAQLGTVLMGAVCRGPRVGTRVPSTALAFPGATLGAAAPPPRLLPALGEQGSSRHTASSAPPRLWIQAPYCHLPTLRLPGVRGPRRSPVRKRRRWTARRPCGARGTGSPARRWGLPGAGKERDPERERSKCPHRAGAPPRAHLYARGAGLHPRGHAATSSELWGSLSPVPPLVFPPKPLTRVSWRTFLNLLCQLIAPGWECGSYFWCAHKRQFPGLVTFTYSQRTPSEGVRGHLPHSRT